MMDDDDGREVCCGGVVVLFVQVLVKYSRREFTSETLTVQIEAFCTVEAEWPRHSLSLEVGKNVEDWYQA